MSKAVVYRAHAADGELLYVGVTGNLAERIKGHRSERSWWRSEVVAVVSDPPQRRTRALAAERQQIQRFQPKYNQRCRHPAMDAVVSLQVDRTVLDRFRKVAEASERTLQGELRQMMRDAVIAFESDDTERAA